MKSSGGIRSNMVSLGIGYYTVPDAARLVGMSARTISRWLGGYSYLQSGKRETMEPLWLPQLPRFGNQLGLGFRDLIELRFVHAFTKAGLGLKTIRHCLEYARECVNDERPFSTQRFRTDGRTIFLDTLSKSGESDLLDLKRHQYVLKQVIENSFKDLDIDNATVTRWRPFKGKPSIVIDPVRAFGQPIAADFGVPTATLADAVKAEGSVSRVVSLFEVSATVVRDAVNFEKQLLAA